MKERSAFTLIELSIVLVIIGLIAGGVLVGQSLIKAAEMRETYADWQKFETARHTFKLKYNCIPGDCITASTFGLGSNGTGDKRINHSAVNAEVYLYWAHLANAGLVEGSYTGTAGGNHEDSIIGTNVPNGARSGVGYTVYSFNAVWFNGFGQNEGITTAFYITGRDPGDRTFGGAFTAQEAYQLDIKYDDGIGNEGAIRTYNNISWYNTTNCNTGVEPNHTYDTTTNGMCNLMYMFKP